MKERIPQKNLIKPYLVERVKHGAYELSLGPEAYITSTPKKQKLEIGGELIIPPGQFGLLLTEETVTISLDAIGFISMRAKWKLGGLINVSGFHVDPGFSNRLKFSVYNAGSRSLHLLRGDPVFMIWFSDLDQTTADGYKRNDPGQNEITADDLNRMHGEVASTGSLKVQIEALKKDYNAKFAILEDKLNTWKEIRIALVVGVFVGVAVLILTIIAERASNKEQGSSNNYYTNVVPTLPPHQTNAPQKK